MRNKKIFCLILCFLILFNFSYSYAEKAQDVNLDSSLFTPKRLSNGQRRFYYNGRFLRDGEFYVIDSKDSSWNGAYSFDEDGFWEESVQVEDSSDLIRVAGGSWKQEDGGWRYVSDQDSVNAVEDDTIEEGNNDFLSIPDNRISDMSHIVRNWELDDKNSENRVFILRDNVECFIDGIENIKQGSDEYLRFVDDDTAASGNSSINTHITTYPQGSNKIKVGIVDSYFIKNHNLLKNNIKGYYDGIRGKEVSNENELNFNPYTNSQEFLNKGLHGTHVAGIISQIAPNAELYVAFTSAWTNINGKTDITSNTNAIISSIDWLVSKGCRIINFSLGNCSSNANSIKTDWNNILAKYKNKDNLIFICALGNESSNVNTTPSKRHYPAGLTESYNNIVSVVNIRMDGEYCKGSNIDPSFKFADIGAPGEQIYSSFSYKKGDTSSMKYMTGTSMATPFVSGAVCRMLENNPNLTSSQIKQKLRSCGKFIDFNKLK